MIYLKLFFAERRRHLLFLGRNGMFKAIGLFVSVSGDIVEFSPITSKSEEGRALIQFPVQDIPAIIEALQKIQADTQAQ